MFSNLKDMEMEDIIETFCEHKTELENFFRRNLKGIIK